MKFKDSFKANLKSNIKRGKTSAPRLYSLTVKIAEMFFIQAFDFLYFKFRYSGFFLFTDNRYQIVECLRIPNPSMGKKIKLLKM